MTDIAKALRETIEFTQLYPEAIAPVQNEEGGLRFFLPEPFILKRNGLLVFHTGFNMGSKVKPAYGLKFLIEPSKSFMNLSIILNQGIQFYRKGMYSSTKINEICFTGYWINKGEGACVEIPRGIEIATIYPLQTAEFFNV